MMNDYEIYYLEELSRILRKKWSICILTDLFLGAKHFQELYDDIPDVSPKVLNESLKELEEYELIKKEALNSKTTEYSLTQKGLWTKDFIIQYNRFLLKMSKTSKQKETIKYILNGIGDES